MRPVGASSGDTGPRKASDLATAWGFPDPNLGCHCPGLPLKLCSEIATGLDLLHLRPQSIVSPGRNVGSAVWPSGDGDLFLNVFVPGHGPPRLSLAPFNSLGASTTPSSSIQHSYPRKHPKIPPHMVAIDTRQTSVSLPLRDPCAAILQKPARSIAVGRSRHPLSVMSHILCCSVMRSACRFDPTLSRCLLPSHMSSFQSR